MKSENIVCFYPYINEVRAYRFFPPIGIEYIATAVEDLVNKIEIVDFRYTKKPFSVFNSGADTVLVSVNWNYDFNFVCNVINNIPEKMQVIVGGRYATDNVEEMFRRCKNIGILVRGEGEATVREIFQGRPVEEIDGVSYIKDGKIIHNKNRDLPALNFVRFPDRKLRSTEYSVLLNGKSTGLGFDSILSSRGCPFNCSFCTFKLNPLGQKRGWEARTPESVVEEIKSIRSDVIAFVDDNFAADLNRVDKICDMLITQGIKKKMMANVRIDITKRKELVKKMSDAGIQILMVGIESAQDKTLKMLHKGFTVRQVHEAFKVFRESNMLVHGYFIVGNIGETREEMLGIADFAKELGLDFIGLSKLRWEKYSPLEKVVKDTPGYYIGDNNYIYSRECSPDELNKIRKTIMREFYTIKHILNIVVKAYRINLVMWVDILKFLIRLPGILLFPKKNNI